MTKKRTQADVPHLLKMFEAAQYLNVSYSTLVKLVADGEGPPAIRITEHGSIRFDRATLDKWIKEREGK